MCNIKSLKVLHFFNILCSLVSPQAVADSVCCTFCFSLFSTFLGCMSETSHRDKSPPLFWAMVREDPAGFSLAALV